MSAHGEDGFTVVAARPPPPDHRMREATKGSLAFFRKTTPRAPHSSAHTCMQSRSKQNCLSKRRCYGAESSSIDGFLSGKRKEAEWRGGGLRCGEREEEANERTRGTLAVTGSSVSFRFRFTFCHPLHHNTPRALPVESTPTTGIEKSDDERSTTE